MSKKNLTPCKPVQPHAIRMAERRARQDARVLNTEVTRTGPLFRNHYGNVPYWQGRRVRPSEYMPHQGDQEKARRRETPSPALARLMAEMKVYNGSAINAVSI